MKKYFLCTLPCVFFISALQLPAHASEISLLTFSEGHTNVGIRQEANIEDGMGSPGDVFIFDQKLLAEDKVTVIGRNAGFCIRTDPGALDYSGTNPTRRPFEQLRAM